MQLLASSILFLLRIRADEDMRAHGNRHIKKALNTDIGENRYLNWWR